MNRCEFWAYFAPAISEMTFAGILATVNDPKIDYTFCALSLRLFHCVAVSDTADSTDSKSTPKTVARLTDKSEDGKCIFAVLDV